jgi:hypothetical protein
MYACMLSGGGELTLALIVGELGSRASCSSLSLIFGAGQSANSNSEQAWSVREEAAVIGRACCE